MKYTTKGLYISFKGIKRKIKSNMSEEKLNAIKIALTEDNALKNFEVIQNRGFKVLGKNSTRELKNLKAKHKSKLK